MNVLLIGHLCIDLLTDPDGNEVQEYGGIARPAAVLGSLLSGRDQVLPVCAVPADELEHFAAYLAASPAVSTAGLFAGEHPLPRIPAGELEGHGLPHEHRPQPPIPFEKIRRHLGAERLLINMVSGMDITLETLDEIRMAVRDRQLPIHLDVHNLTLRRTKGGQLVRGPLELWRRWAFMMDTLQMNEQEIAALSVEKMKEEATAGHLLTLGPHAVIVTRGERGVTVYKNDRKQVVREDIPGVVSRRAKPGCGDVFGAAFVARRAEGADPVEAARAANALAAERCTVEASPPPAML
jgi:sugar/nucleoside kinase (ribokinase family)